MDALRNWFEQLDSRERLLVALAGVLLMIAIVVLGGLRPLMKQSKQNAQLVSDRETLLLDLENVAARLGPQRGSTNTSAANSGQSLVLLIDQSSRARSLDAYLKRNQPEGDTRIRLRFERAPFETLLAWLVDLETKHAVSIESANIDMSKEPGRVNTNLILSRTAG